MATTTTRGDFTWTHADAVVGTFANGDPWAKETAAGAGLSITNVSPAPDNTTYAYVINGSEVNPIGEEFAKHGFDSRILYYRQNQNLGHGGASSFPWTVPANSSLVSVESLNPSDPNQDRPALKDAAVLTVLSDAVTPSAGDFRPPYCGGDKEIRWNVSDIVWSRLPGLIQPNSGINVPTIADQVSRTDGLWLIHAGSSQGREIHPADNMPEYGRDVANRLSNAILRCCLDDGQAALETLVIQLIQIGIDVYGAASTQTSNIWPANGGHNSGFKMALLFAGWMLDDADILWYADKENFFGFQEDQQIFTVTQSDVDDCPKYDGDGRTRECYTSEMIGLSEWGEKHDRQPSRDGSNWGVTYRDVAGSAAFGHFVAARILGVETQWNNPAFFDYYESRYWVIEEPKAGTGSNTMATFERDMFAQLLQIENGNARPVANQSGRGYESAIDVELSTPSDGASIYYTTDGSDPDNTDTLYTGLINLTATTTLKAVAWSEAGGYSEILTQTYTIDLSGAPSAPINLSVSY